MRTATLWCLAWVLLSVPVFGQSKAGIPPADESQAAKVVDPTAVLMTFTFENKYSPSLWGVKDKQNELEGTFVIPFYAFGVQNVGRIKMRYLTSSPSGQRGLTDSDLLDLVLLAPGWGTIGVGGDARLFPDAFNGSNTLAVGPAIAAVARRAKWKYGFLNQNFFSGDTISESEVEPVLAYTFNPKWSAAMGDLEYVYDWKQGRFTNVPVGAQLNYIASFGIQDVRLFFGGEYNLKNDFESPKWTLKVGFALITK
jgi:hypothetical protein